MSKILASKQNSLDLEKDADKEVDKDNITVVPVETDEYDFLKVKEKPPPGINASLVMLYAIFLLMFVTGWVNLNSCPLNRLIPIYLIVGGAFLPVLCNVLNTEANKFALNKNFNLPMQ